MKVFSILSAYSIFTANPLVPDQSFMSDQPQATLRTDEVITGSSLLEGKVEAFRGIPYAEPPVSDLRFKKPQEYTRSYHGLNATEFGYSCMALPFNIAPFIKYMSKEYEDAAISLSTTTAQNEDCLTINVYRPSTVKPGQKLPVMFWIYGGAFVSGSSSPYKGEQIVAESIDIGLPVIYVSFNYRLGPWGFFGGKEMLAAGSTNVGFLDQRLALEWVSKNIHSFGGDPDNVTIFGESAGGISVAHHMIANGGNNTFNGKPLFTKAILQSGGLVPTLDVTSKLPQTIFDKIVRALGCAESEDKIACLQTKDTQAIWNQTNALPEAHKIMAFFPRQDNGIFPYDPYTAFAQGKFARVPYVVGTQEDEGTIFILSTVDTSAPSNSSKSGSLESLFSSYNASTVAKFLKLYPNDPNLGSPYRTFKLNCLTPQYKMLSSVFGDLLFESPRRFMIEHSPEHLPVYTYLGATGYGVPYLGTPHTSDLLWQYELDFGPSKVYNGYFISFANTGDVNNHYNRNLPYWPRRSKDQNKSLRINLDSVDLVSDTFRAEAIKFLADAGIKI